MKRGMSSRRRIEKKTLCKKEGKKKKVKRGRKERARKGDSYHAYTCTVYL